MRRITKRCRSTLIQMSTSKNQATILLSRSTQLRHLTNKEGWRTISSKRPNNWTRVKSSTSWALSWVVIHKQLSVRWWNFQSRISSRKAFLTKTYRKPSFSLAFWCYCNWSIRSDQGRWQWDFAMRSYLEALSLASLLLSESFLSNTNCTTGQTQLAR